MGLGQPVQLLDAATQANAKNLTTPNGNQGMGQLKAFGQGVFLAPRIQIGKDAFAPPFAGGNDQRKHHHQQDGDQKEHPGIDAAKEQNAHRDDSDHQKSAHVGLCQQKHTHQHHCRSHGHDMAQEAFFDIHLSNHVISRINQHCQLGQLRGLKAQRAQRNPAARAIHHLAHRGQQHQRQQQQREQKQTHRMFLPHRHRHLKDQQGRSKGQAQPHQVPD